jgi:hypothetical protein
MHMTDPTPRRPGTLALLASLPVLLSLLGGCFADDGPAEEPQSEATATPTPRIRLGDISVAAPALAQRAGLYMCGEHIVASAPAGGIELDSFVVFDLDTREGQITEVTLPRRLRPNARWLLTTQCVSSGGEPFVSVAYQEMPLTPTGGNGVRAAYSLDGERLWIRDDLNQPAQVVEDVLVLGSTAEQPETAVDLRTGRTQATFDPAVQSRTVVSGNRMVVRGLSGPPVLTTLTGDRIASLRPASFYNAAGGLLFGTTPSALPDRPGDEDPDGLTDASPSPSPTQLQPPEPTSGLSQGEVHAYSLRSGQPAWHLDIAPDPLEQPTFEPQSGIVVVLGAQGLAHGIDAASGVQEWRAPTELEDPRVTAGAGIVLFDNVEEPLQKLVDARTGLPLPEPEEPIVDLQANGALRIIDGVASVAAPSQLRSPPTTAEESF